MWPAVPGSWPLTNFPPFCPPPPDPATLEWYSSRTPRSPSPGDFCRCCSSRLTCSSLPCHHSACTLTSALEKLSLSHPLLCSQSTRASHLEHLSWIINKLTCGIICTTSVPCSPEGRNWAQLCSWPSANEHLINMWSVDEVNECTNCPKKPQFMSEGKWLPSLLAHSFPHVPPNSPGTFISFLGPKGSVWLS